MRLSQSSWPWNRYAFILIDYCELQKKKKIFFRRDISFDYFLGLWLGQTRLRLTISIPTFIIFSCSLDKIFLWLMQRSCYLSSHHTVLSYVLFEGIPFRLISFLPPNCPVLKGGAQPTNQSCSLIYKQYDSVFLLPLKSLTWKLIYVQKYHKSPLVLNIPSFMLHPMSQHVSHHKWMKIIYLYGDRFVFGWGQHRKSMFYMSEQRWMKANVIGALKPGASFTKKLWLHIRHADKNVK